MTAKKNQPTSAILSQNEQGTMVLTVFLSDGSTHTLIGDQAIAMASKLRSMGVPVSDIARVAKKIRDKGTEDKKEGDEDNQPARHRP